ncbi:hypothetical protein [Bdellovibrio bacteriovorus]|uniref:hypothetical protein n=1 Tax=Bdellovibrio bacteriovorus TaxID=959 RepID=UPI0035A62BFC
MKTLNVSVIFMSLVGTATAFAVPGSLTYQGRIKNSDGLPLEVNGVRFEFSVTNPAGTCVLYKEVSSSIDMRNSAGVFDVPIGTGTKNYPADPGFKLLDAFDNTVTLNCEGGGTYAPVADDKRLLRVQFYDGTGWKLISPDSEIRSVPFAGHAQYAQSAQKLGTNIAADFILKSGLPLCGAGEYLRHIAPAGTFECTVPAVNGSDVSGNISGSSAGFTGNLSGDVSGTQSATSVDKIKGVSVNMAGLASGKILKYNGTNWAPADDTDTNTDDKIRGVNVSATTPQTGQVLVHDGSQWAPQYFGMGQLRSTVTGTAQVPASCSTADKTLTWNAITDSFACTTIAIANTQVTGLGTAATKNFGTSSGNLVELDGSGKIPAALLPSSAGSVLDGGNATGATVSVGTNDGQALSFETNNSARMTITSAGDIGIGTASPGYRLQVNKTSNSTTAGNVAASFNFMWAAPTSSSASTFVGQYNGAESDGTSAAITGDILAQINYTHHNGSNTLNKLVASWSGTYNKSSATVGTSLGVQGEVNNDASGIITNAMGFHSRIKNNGSGSITNAYGVYVDSVQGTNKWSIYTTDATAPSYFAGNVGIGTVLPDNVKFEVNGPPRGTLIGIPGKYLWNIHATDSSTTAAGVGGGIGFQGKIDGSATAWTFSGIHGGKENATSGNYAGYLSFHTRANGSHENETMRITSAGNVGIGTTSPSRKLAVSGTAEVSNSLYIKDTNSASSSFDAAELSTYMWDNTAGAEGSGLSIYTKTNGSRTAIIDFTDSIFTYYPLRAETDWTYLERAENTVYGHWLYFQKARGNYTTTAAVQSGDELMNLASIGATGTTYNWSGYSTNIRALATENFTAGGQGGKLQFMTAANGTTTAVTRMTIDQNGNVGIGAATPAERLDLGGGNIKIGHEIVVANQAAGAAVGWYYATCPAGKYVTGGSCSSGSGTMNLNSDLTQTTYGCYKPDTSSNIVIKAVCMNVR